MWLWRDWESENGVWIGAKCKWEWIWQRMNMINNARMNKIEKQIKIKNEKIKFKNKRKYKKLKMVDSIIDMGNLKLNPLLRKGWFPRGF